MQWLEKSYRVLFRILLIIGATFLAGMMFTVMTDLVLRYLFKSPLIGAYELVEFMMACVVPVGVAYCAMEHEHVSVDIVFEKLPQKMQTILSAFTHLVAVSLSMLIAWQAILFVKETYESHFSSMVLHIPQYPFNAMIALGLIVLFIVLLFDFIHILRIVVRK